MVQVQEKKMNDMEQNNPEKYKKVKKMLDDDAKSLEFFAATSHIYPFWLPLKHELWHSRPI